MHSFHVISVSHSRIKGGRAIEGRSTSKMPSVNADNCGYCFLDIDIDNHRNRLATAAAFVEATDSRYGFSSKRLLSLGGSEVSRIPELIETDHEWSSKNTECGGIATKPTQFGNRMIIRLFWDVAPLACENFATLCGNGSLFPGETGKPKPAPLGEGGKPLTFRKTKFHRVIPGFVMQGGDFVFQNGSGGESVFGKKFKDERAGLQRKHDHRGILSMGNSGKNSNSSQFFLTFDKTPQCDGKHVIFGELISGFEILDAVEKVGTPGGEPSVSVTITECGIYEPLQTPACGYWYDTPDADSFSGISPVFVVRPRIVLLVPSASVLQKFTSATGACVSVVSHVVSDETPSSKDQWDKVVELLATYAADVVVVAPACWKDVASEITLPKAWEDFEISEVVIVAKPLEVVSKLRSESWLRSNRSQWQLEGNTGNL